MQNLYNHKIALKLKYLTHWRADIAYLVKTLEHEKEANNYKMSGKPRNTSKRTSRLNMMDATNFEN